MPPDDVRVCRVCGCTDLDACVSDGVPCHWVQIDLCSACAPTDDAPAVDVTAMAP